MRARVGRRRDRALAVVDLIEGYVGVLGVDGDLAEEGVGHRQVLSGKSLSQNGGEVEDRRELRPLGHWPPSAGWRWP